MGNGSGLKTASETRLDFGVEALPKANRITQQAKEAGQTGAATEPSSLQALSTPAAPLSLKANAPQIDRTKAQLDVRAGAPAHSTQAIATREEIVPVKTQEELQELEQKLRSEQQELSRKIAIAEKFRKGIEKNVAGLEKEAQGAKWYRLRFDGKQVQAQLEQEKKLLASQLEREKELREQLEKSQKLMEAAQKVEKEAQVLIAEGKIEQGVAALSSAQYGLGQALSAVGSKDFLNKAAVTANIEATRKITEEQLRIIGRMETAEKVLGGFSNAVWEVVGVNDFGRGIASFREGRILSGLAHTGLGVFSVATLGVGGAWLSGAKQATKLAAKEGAELLAKRVVKEAVEKVGVGAVQKLAVETGQAVARRSLKQIAKELPKHLVREGGEKALAKVTQKGLEQTQRIVAKNMKRAVLRLERKLPLADAVANQLKWISKSKVDNIAAKLVEMGMDSKKALKSAKAMKKSLKAGGKLEKALVEGLEQGMQKELRGVLKKGIMQGFQKTFDDGIAALGKRLNLDDAAKQLLKKAGREGAEEGFEAGLKALARRAVRKGLKKFKKSRRGLYNSGLSNRPDELKAHKAPLGRAVETPAAKAAKPKIDGERLRMNPDKSAARAHMVSVVEEVQGQRVRRVFRLTGDKRELVSTQVLGEAQKTAAKTRKVA